LNWQRRRPAGYDAVWEFTMVQSTITRKKMKSAIITMLLLAATLSARAQSKPVDPAYQQDFDKWKADLVEDLKENWLPLAGLFWLKPGANTFGTDSKSSLVLPEHSAPASAGTFALEGSEITVNFSPGVAATVDGKAADKAKLQPDTSGKPSVIELGKLRMHVIQRGQRIGIRVKDLDSPAVKNYRGPIFYPLQPDFKITASWEPSDGKKMVDVPNVLGDVTPTPVAGVARFKINGQEVQLSALGGDPKDGLFFIFKDQTSKTETYPPGRFLQTDAVVNNTLVIDFNRAYNPPCAVTPYATCPLPPKENQLAVAIAAGEKYDRKNGHH
jgi:uncharacterized protein